MENQKILIDTSLVIDFWRKKNKQKTILWKLMENYDISISSITEFELFVGTKNKNQANEVLEIIKHFDIINFDSEIARLSSEIYKDLKKKNLLIDFNDIFIGASAIKNNLQIATLNIEHFRRIDSLKLFETK